MARCHRLLDWTPSTPDTASMYWHRVRDSICGLCSASTPASTLTQANGRSSSDATANKPRRTARTTRQKTSPPTRRRVAGAVQQGGHHADGGVLPAGEPVQGSPFIVADVEALQCASTAASPSARRPIPPLGANDQRPTTVVKATDK